VTAPPSRDADLAPKVCAITGANGLLGWHGSAAARFKHGMAVRRDARAEWLEPEAITRLVDGADTVLHFAALNRAPDAQVTAENAAITATLIAALRAAKAKPRTVVFSNSTHVSRDTAYGQSKRDTAEQLSAVCAEFGARFIDVVLPNVFGECGKPFSNSVVHTFCQQLAGRETPRVDGNGSIVLAHAGNVVDAMFAARAAEASGRFTVAGELISVPDLLAVLQQQIASYRAGVFPSVAKPLELKLFNTLRSFMLRTDTPYPLTLRTDDRGTLAETVKSEGGGQIFYSTTKPGITRGNHVHFGKVERFAVVQGEAIIRIRRLFSTAVHEFRVNGAEPVAVDMPTLHTHNITNVGTGPLLTLFWTHEIFDPARPDTYAEPV
jgi:UDP-2-acetamido-2,6-beta-L-arabino-hexul-4-ose reductase